MFITKHKQADRTNWPDQFNWIQSEAIHGYEYVIVHGASFKYGNYVIPIAYFT